MKATHRILGILWMAICGYFCVSLCLATYHTIKYTMSGLDWVFLEFFFMLLNLVGVVASVSVFRGSRWGRMIVGVVALLTVTASVMGCFAWFNSLPFSFVGIVFDIFALASGGVLLFSRKYDVA
jgi:hypothetical protein